MKWLHCNVCTKQPHISHDGTVTSTAADALHMTNCGHVFCADCLPKTANACLICHTSPLAAVSVFSGGAGRDVASVFADTVEATKRIATAHQFQSDHSTKLLFALRQKSDDVEVALQDARSRLSISRSRNRSANKELECLKKTLVECGKTRY